MNMDESGRQALNIVPPRRGAVCAITVDTTARSYDISALDLGKAYDSQNADGGVYITMQAESTTVYFYFCDTSAVGLDETAAVAAGGTAAFANTYGAMLPQSACIDTRIVRAQDKYLVVKGAAAGKIRLWASSQPPVM